MVTYRRNITNTDIVFLRTLRKFLYGAINRFFKTLTRTTNTITMSSQITNPEKHREQLLFCFRKES